MSLAVEPSVVRARNAVGAVFIGAGFAFASWAAQIPQVRDRLGVSPAELGVILLAVAVGSLVSLPLAGTVVTHLGERRAVTVMALLLSVGLAVAALGYAVSSIPVLVIALVMVGFGNGTWDVAMNVHGAVVERQLGRAVMPRFHAGFSIGTVAGALIGAAAIAAGISPAMHLTAVAVVVAVAVPYAAARFLPHRVDPTAPVPTPGEHRRRAMRGWREPRTLVIGVFVLCMAFTEGAGNDWLSVAMIDGYGTSATLGTLTFAVFLGAMTTGRWFGTGAIDRFGRLGVIRVTVVIAALGLSVVIFSGSLPFAVAGAALWGLGASLGFPVGMSAAADDPAQAAGRVSVVASIGYVSFLAGPPLIGILGDHIGVLDALTVLGAVMAVALLLSSVVRPLESRAQQQS